jgi:hypothetical protein
VRPIRCRYSIKPVQRMRFGVGPGTMSASAPLVGAKRTSISADTNDPRLPNGCCAGWHGRKSRRRRWAWGGGLTTWDHRHPTCAARTAWLNARLLPHTRALSLVDDHVVLAALNKCLAQSNKSRPPSKATKRQRGYRPGWSAVSKAGAGLCWRAAPMSHPNNGARQ